MAGFPRYVPVADAAVLVEFATVADDAAHARVLHLDAALAGAPLPGVVEWVPALVSLLVSFNPLVTDHAAVTAGLRALGNAVAPPRPAPRTHEVPVCYDADLAPDLARVAAAVGMDVEALIAAHLAGDYRVFMYGFAPGYAYLDGLPGALHLPRKPAAQRGVPAGSVIIAGGQCLITTLQMPTGWWIIGRSPRRILCEDTARPFLFDVGDRVRFRRVSRAGMAG